MLNPDLQSLLQQSLSGNNSLLNGGAASLSGLASSLSNLNQCSGETEKKETVDSIDTIKRETPSPCTKYRQGMPDMSPGSPDYTLLAKGPILKKFFSSKSAQ